MEKSLAYTRLPGRRSRFVSGVALYGAEDHLLSVVSTGFREEYRRFHYTDIQAIVACRTPLGSVTNTICGIGLGLTAALAAGAALQGSLAWTGFAFAAASFLVSLALNVKRGPTCVCRIQTAVQAEDLPSINRVPMFERLMAFARPRIEQCQGVLPAGVQLDVAPKPPPGRPAQPAAGPAGVPASKNEVRFHAWMFASLFTDAWGNAIAMISASAPMYVLSMFITLGMSALVVLSLVRQRSHAMPTGVGGLSWAAAVLVSLEWFWGWIDVVMVSAGRREGFGTQWDMVKALADRSPADFPVATAVHVSFMVLSIIVSVAGIFMLERARRNSAHGGIAG